MHRPPAAPVAVTPSRPKEETSYERRERLRGERSAMARELSRRTKEPYRAIHARVNQATGARSVGAATEKQLVKGNAILAKWLRR